MLGECNEEKTLLEKRLHVRPADVYLVAEYKASEEAGDTKSRGQWQGT